MRRSMRFFERWRAQFADAWSAARQTARLAIGLPDYAAYVEHMRAQHPDATPMTREAFAIERMHARYAPGRSRCC